MKCWRFIIGGWCGLMLGCVADAPKPPHWAFQPRREVALPTVTNTAWCQTALDRFILSRLEANGLTPAPPADRRALIRRATFDLIGLPPTADEIDAFLGDSAPDAFARVVDRLLDSPQYGEHWGRHWLDVVRYADTAGETADYPVPVAWRYRNYVIAAFNSDKPYDEFLREQIAGDILARRGPRDRYAERVTATGYLALSRRFGFDSENYHHLTIQDTLDTLGQSVLGLSLGCARCHDHKFDPIPMSDYYALYGIFDSTRYAFPGSEQKQKYRALVPLLPPEESQPGWRDFENRVAALTQKLERLKQSTPTVVLRSLDDLDGDFELQAPAAGGSKGVLVPPWVCEGPIAITSDAQSPFKNLYPFGKVGASVPAGTNEYRITQALHPRRTRQHDGALHINLDFRVATNEAAARASHRFWLGASSSAPAVEVLLSSGTASLRTGDRVELLRALQPDQWHNLQLTLDLKAGTVSGRVGLPGDVASFPERPLSPSWTGTLEDVGFDSSDMKDSRLPALSLDNLAVQPSPIPPVSTNSPALAASSGELDASALTAQLPQPGEVDKIRRELDALLADGPFALAYATSEGTPRNARIQLRGDPEKPGEEVPRGFLQVLGGGPLAKETSGSGRLELAEWLTSPANPLTARVMANRIWQYHFGQGLVKTPNDFGTRGLRPTHPELLDYLAGEFIRSGWSIKSMHRLIMASAVYQQGSRWTGDGGRWAVGGGRGTVGGGVEECPVIPNAVPGPSVRTRDAVATDSFSPFPRRRLGAEETRDAILSVSGELDSSSGLGHSFPAPTGWGYTQHAPFSAVYDHHQRSVYLMTQRIKRHPFLALFDGADPNASTPERRTTTVPTQALFFLNDPFVHASAEKLAVRVGVESAGETKWIEAAYRCVLGREATPAERAEAAKFLADYRAELTAAQQAEPEQASRAAFARVLLGSNEFLTVD